MIGATIGIAQQENKLNIHQPISEFLEEGWTNMSQEKEQKISIKNLLSMTSGIDDTKQLIIKRNLNYVADSGKRWAYSNVFQKLFDVINKVVPEGFETYFTDKIKTPIGMDGYWKFGPIFKIYHSTARGMARFGLLALNKGIWENKTIINLDFFEESIHSSQSVNPAYGYFWWLNGQSKFMVPNDQTIFNGALIPNAPPDTFAAMGAFDQRIYIIPSKKMVIIRMGNAANSKEKSFAKSSFDYDLWVKINAVIN